MTAPQTVADVQHTPGPWTMTGPFNTNDFDKSEGWYRIEAARTLDLRVCRCGDGYVEGENEANARLISAAPDLLRALEDMLEDIAAGVSHTSGCFDRARTAIASARQETRHGE